MDQFTGILLHMHLVNADLFLAHGSVHHQPAVVANGHIKLRNLVVLRVIRIEIVFPVKTAVLVDTAVCRKAKSQCIFHHLFVENRKASGHSRADRAGVGVGRTSEFCGASAENLCG